MQDMIKRIIEADTEARALEESNKLAAEKDRRRIEEQAEAIYRKYMDEARAEIAKDATYLDKLYDRKQRDISAKQESVQIKLKSDFEMNRDRWVDEIVARVIDGG